MSFIPKKGDFQFHSLSGKDVVDAYKYAMSHLLDPATPKPQEKVMGNLLPYANASDYAPSVLTTTNAGGDQWYIPAYNGSTWAGDMITVPAATTELKPVHKLDWSKFLAPAPVVDRAAWMRDNPNTPLPEGW